MSEVETSRLVRRPKRIFLVRHGESVANVDQSLHSSIQDHLMTLTHLGHEQSREAGRAILREIGGERLSIYGSPFTRTRETLRGILESIPSNRVWRIREDPRIREQEYGHLRPIAEATAIEQERGEFGTFYYRVPDGESGADVYDRCSSFLDTLFRDFNKPDYPENVLIVTHGLTLRLFLMRWFHWTPEEFERKRNPGNCSIYQLIKGADARYSLSPCLAEHVG